MTTPFLKVFDTMSEVTQSFQVKQWWCLEYRNICCRGVAGPTGGNGSVIAVDVTDDEIGIRTPTNTDDFYLLTM